MSTPGMGHNGGPPLDDDDDEEEGTSQTFSAKQLKSIVERIEHLEEEKANIAADIREIFAEAKGDGFDTKVLRQLLKIRKMDKSERYEQEAILDTYLAVFGL